MRLFAGNPGLGKAVLASLMGHPLASNSTTAGSHAGAESQAATPSRQLDSWELTGKGASAALAERVRQVSAQVSCSFLSSMSQEVMAVLTLTHRPGQISPVC